MLGGLGVSGLYRKDASGGQQDSEDETNGNNFGQRPPLQQAHGLAGFGAAPSGAHYESINWSVRRTAAMQVAEQRRKYDEQMALMSKAMEEQKLMCQELQQRLLASENAKLAETSRIKDELTRRDESERRSERESREGRDGAMAAALHAIAGRLAKPERPKEIAMLKGSEIESLKLTGEPGSVSTWRKLLEGRIGALHEECKVIFTADERTWAAVADDEQTALYDAWLARVLHACMHMSSPYIKELMSDMATMPACVMQSGRMMLECINNMHTFKTTAEAKRRLAVYKDKVYFTAGMTEIEARLSARQLLQDYAALPHVGRSAEMGVSVLFERENALICKMPSALKEEKTELERLLTKAEIKSSGGRVVDFEYSEDELVHYVAALVAGMKPAREVNATERERGGRPNSRGGGGDPNARGGGGADDKCSRCGGTNRSCKASGRDFRSCPAPDCKKCGLGWCGSIFGRACIADLKEEPKNLKDANNVRLPPSLQRKSLRVWKKANVSANVTESEAEADCAECECTTFASPFSGEGNALEVISESEAEVDCAECECTTFVSNALEVIGKNHMAANDCKEAVDLTSVLDEVMSPLPQEATPEIVQSKPGMPEPEGQCSGGGEGDQEAVVAAMTFVSPFQEVGECLPSDVKAWLTEHVAEPKSPCPLMMARGDCESIAYAYNVTAGPMYAALRCCASAIESDGLISAARREACSLGSQRIAELVSNMCRASGLCGTEEFETQWACERDGGAVRTFEVFVPNECLPAEAASAAAYPVELCANVPVIMNSEVKGVEVLLDGGANVNIFREPEALACGHVMRERGIRVMGIGAGAGSDIESMVRVNMLWDGAAMSLMGGYSPNARRTIVSESYLWDNHKARVLKEPVMRVVFESGSSVGVRRHNGLYFVNDACYHDASAPADINSPECNLARVTSQKQMGGEAIARLWAARMHLTGEGLRRFIKVTAGHGIESVTKRMADVADSDIFRSRANARRGAVKASEERCEECGKKWQMDCWGPAHSHDPIDKSRFHLTMACASCGCTYDAMSTNHTMEVLKKFVLQSRASEQKLGHTMQELLVDQAPEHFGGAGFDTKKFKEWAASLQPPIDVIFAPREQHESVRLVNVQQDAVQRAAEASLERGQKSNAWLLRARVYAARLRNFKADKDNERSRYTLHCGKMPPLVKPPPICFGTDVLVKEEKQRFKGEMRASDGWIAGIDGASYQIVTPQGKLITQLDVKPLNEMALIDRGIPSSVASCDAETQCGGNMKVVGVRAQPVQGDAASVQPVPAVRASKPSSFPPLTRLEKDMPNSDLVGPPSKRTRGSLKQAAFLIQEQMEACNGDVEQYNQFAFQAIGDAAFAFEATAEREVAEQLMAMAAAEPAAEANAFEALAASSQQQIEVNSPSGKQIIVVPAGTEHGIANSPQEAQWREAVRKAVEAIFAAGNRLVRRSEAKGKVICPSVVPLRVKVNQEDGTLATENAFKARVAYDESFIKRKGLEHMLQRGEKRVVRNIDDMTLKMMLARAGAERRKLYSLDLGDAYSTACRQTEPSYMALPDCHKLFDESGEELIVELVTPWWGDATAGVDLDDDFVRDLEDGAWLEADGTPGLHVKELGGGAVAECGKQVDDLLVSLPADASDEHVVKLAAWLGRFGTRVKVKSGATSFNGVSWRQDVGAGTLTAGMHQKVEEVVTTYLPGLRNGERPSARLGKQTLKSLCEGLTLAPPTGTGKINPSQHRVQKICGALKYPAKYMPALELPLHYLSCVAARSSEHGGFVAELLIELAYDHRFDGLTWGGAGVPSADAWMSAGMPLDTAPRQLLGVGDATWLSEPDRYSVVIMAYGAAVHHETKLLKLVCESSQRAEGVASERVRQLLEQARSQQRSARASDGEPCLLLTDNSSNKQLINQSGTPGRARHAIRRYHSLIQSVKQGSIRAVHVPDAVNPADFLTKFVGKAKLKASLEFITNIKHRVAA